ESFDDTAESLAAIAESLRYGGSWLDWITGAGVSHVAFAATKADHVPEASRENLAALLGDLVSSPRARVLAAGAEVSVQAIAALRCTEDTLAERDGHAVPAVRGVLLETGRWAR
ncbi:YcjX family protein, partial [Roseomonas sp. DSM 102946]|nr:YcjX family protein [Roseomonas sp. DSM 102946]